MRDFEFNPGYYEWHLTDKATGELLLNIVDPFDDMFNPETGEPLSRTETDDMAYYWLEEAERCYDEGEPFNGVLPDSDPLDEDEKKKAAAMIADTLYNHYIA